MALKFFYGAETRGSAWTRLFSASGVGSVVEVSTSAKRSGDYGFRCRGDSAGSSAIMFPSGRETAYNLATFFGQFYIKFVALPSSDDEPIAAVHTSGVTTHKGELRIGSDGTVRWYDSGPTLKATSTTVLSTGSWYRIELKCGTGAASDYEVRIYTTPDGTSPAETLSGTGDHLTDNMRFFAIGKRVDRNGETMEAYYDDIALCDTDWIGPIQVGLINVDGAGTHSDFADGAGDGDYRDLDEIVPDGDTTYLIGQTSGDKESCTMESAATGGISGTIHGVIVYISHGKVTSDSTSRWLVRRSTSEAVSITCSAYYTTYEMWGRLFLVDPSTSAAWDTTGIDEMECGVECRNSTYNLKVSTLFAEVCYTPAAGATLPIFMLAYGLHTGASYR